MTRPLQPPPDHVSMRWFSEGLLERTRKVRRTSLRDGAEVSGVVGAMQISFDEGPHARELPAGQGARLGAVSARMTLDLGLQNGGRRGQRCFRSLPITFELASGGLEKFGQAACQIMELQAGRRRRIRYRVSKPVHIQSSTTVPLLPMGKRMVQTGSFGLLSGVLNC